MPAHSPRPNERYDTRGEAATAAALGSRGMRAEGWRVVDAVPFEHCDVDHVAVRPGLVVALETFRTDARWELVDGRLDAPDDPLGAAAGGARKIRHLLASVVDTKVHAVVAVWGDAARTLPRDVSYDEPHAVWIVRGRSLSDIDGWLEPFEAAHPTLDEVTQCVEVIESFVRTRDAHDARRPVATHA